MKADKQFWIILFSVKIALEGGQQKGISEKI